MWLSTCAFVCDTTPHFRRMAEYPSYCSQHKRQATRASIRRWLRFLCVLYASVSHLSSHSFIVRSLNDNDTRAVNRKSVLSFPSPWKHLSVHDIFLANGDIEWWGRSRDVMWLLSRQKCTLRLALDELFFARQQIEMFEPQLLTYTQCSQILESGR